LIIRKVNPVAYELQLPATSSVHPIFHVSQLKAATGASVQVSAHIPDLEQSWYIPVAILDQRLCRRAGNVIPQILVHTIVAGFTGNLGGRVHLED
jgi:hypothetical protein